MTKDTMTFQGIASNVGFVVTVFLQKIQGNDIVLPFVRIWHIVNDDGEMWYRKNALLVENSLDWNKDGQQHVGNQNAEPGIAEPNKWCLM